MEKAPLLRPSSKNGNLKALIESWPVGGLQPDTFVQPQREGAGRRDRSPPQTLPIGAGPHGKGSRRDRCVSPGGLGHPSISRRRAPSAEPLVDRSLQRN